MSNLTGVPVPGVGRPVAPTPGDSMMSGIHADIRGSSKHKQAVSGVLHLKKEGGRSNPSAFHANKTAFPKPKRGKLK